MIKDKILISIEAGLRTKVDEKTAKYGGRFSNLVERLIKDFLNKEDKALDN